MNIAPPALENTSDGASAGRPARHARRMRLIRRVAAYALALLVLAIVFLSYRSPDLLFTVATQVWSCF
jgi:hypothetical protein